MGCDIHGYCEVYKDGKWEMVSGFPDTYNPEKLGNEPYGGRNYRLFSLLADVRNYGDIIPISQPRGVPKDASDDYKAIVKQWSGDGHSHSYLILDELLLVDFDQEIEVTGVVDEKTYLEVKNGKNPQSYSGGVGGPDIYHLTNEEMDQVLNNKKEFIDKNLFELLNKTKQSFKSYPTCPAAKNVEDKLEKLSKGEIDYEPIEFVTSYSWKEKLKNCLDTSFFDQCVPAMLAKSPSGDSIDVRYIFFFDN